jgi:hypothetical protein
MLSFKTVGAEYSMNWKYSIVLKLVKLFMLFWKSSSIYVVRVDLGTSDYLGLDVLLNCLTQLSSE